MPLRSVATAAALLFAILLLPLATQAQGELNCTVRINTPQLQLTDRRVFDELEVSMRDFLNTTKWTTDAFEPQERLECSFIMTIKGESPDNTFEADLAVQATRPVYGSTYKTALLSHLDKDLRFTFQQGQPLEFLRDATDNSNLTSVLAFYAYLILAIDYDSFSLYGGDAHVSTANQIVTNIQNSSNNGTPGWRLQDGGKSRNRAWIVENLTNPRVKPIRASYYNYHRMGLDLFSTDAEKGRAGVLLALEDIDKVTTAYFNSMLVQMFTNAKRDELVEMWKAAPKPQKERVIQILIKADPANTQRYRDIGS